MATLSLSGLKKAYGATQVIHGLDLEVHHGEFIVFVGPSGCGKSTLLRMIAGLETITEGEISIDGMRVNETPAAERGLAMVFQSYALYPHMSVKQNLSFGLENMAMPKAEIERRIEEAARMLRMEQLLQRRPGQLSGGQRQRVAIGRAVVREPKIFLFDEPLSNLDAELRVAMRGEITALHERLGNTMIYVTHDQVEAMTMADRIAVLRDGRLEQFGTPLELYNRPANQFVAGFIGSPRMNFLSATITGADMMTLKGHGTLPAKGPMGQEVVFGIRPEHVTLDDQSQTRLNLTQIEQLGGESYLYGTLASQEKLCLRLSGQTSLKRGDSIGLGLGEADQRHIFDATTGVRLPQ